MTDDELSQWVNTHGHKAMAYLDHWERHHRCRHRLDAVPTGHACPKCGEAEPLLISRAIV